MFIFGCAHYHKVEGSEQKSEIPEGFRVKIGAPEVKEGDSVDILKKTCPHARNTTRGRVPSTPDCTTTKIGSSKVLKVLTKDTAIIETPAGIKFDSNVTVEKSENN